MFQQRYAEQIKLLSDRLVEIQRPITVLDAIKWPQAFESQFIGSGGTRLPAVDQDFYQAQGLRFDAAVKTEELRQLRSDIRRRLGRGDRLGKIMEATIDQYQLVVEMLQQRGRPEFLTTSRALYGSARDHLSGDRKTLIELGERLCGIFSLPAASHLAQAYPKEIEATRAVEQLQQRLVPYFGDQGFSVELSDGIVSDASAGGDRIKINSYSRFSELDLRVLEVHEGWVHIGTTLNGRRQPWASWLSVGSPRITAIQEGLAVLIETLTFSSFPDRARRISDRVVAIDLAEQGADFIEVYRFFVNRGVSEQASYKVAQRVFRGGMVAGGACFTKDLSYVRGFVETVNFIKSAITAGVPEILPMLFVGKVTLDDLPVLYEYAQDGLIAKPEFLPPMFRDLNGLYTWFGFSSGMSLVNLGRVQRHFASLFEQLPQCNGSAACPVAEVSYDD